MLNTTLNSQKSREQLREFFIGVPLSRSSLARADDADQIVPLSVRYNQQPFLV
jgi:hypothetical protein